MKRKNIAKAFILLILFCFLSLLIFQNSKIKQQETIIHTKKIFIQETYKKVMAKKKNFYAYLSIPELHINRFLYPIGNKQNTVEKEVMVLETSNFSSGDIALAAHSGIGLNTYFNSLENLDENMKIYIFHKENIYTYYLIQKKEVNKTGYVDLDIYSFPTLKLITCNKNDNKKQFIYTAKLVKKEST